MTAAQCPACGHTFADAGALERHRRNPRRRAVYDDVAAADVVRAIEAGDMSDEQFDALPDALQDQVRKMLC